MCKGDWAAYLADASCTTASAAPAWCALSKGWGRSWCADVGAGWAVPSSCGAAAEAVACMDCLAGRAVGACCDLATLVIAPSARRIAEPSRAPAQRQQSGSCCRWVHTGAVPHTFAGLAWRPCGRLALALLASASSKCHMRGNVLRMATMRKRQARCRARAREHRIPLAAADPRQPRAAPCAAVWPGLRQRKAGA